MTTLADLKNAYDSYLSGFAPVTSSGQANDAFEVYVLTLVLRAAKKAGATITFESNSGVTTLNSLKFRTSPGRIYAPTHDYTHAVLRFPRGLTYEAHIGVYIEGLAAVLHECDVAVIEASEAIFCRRTHVNPKKKNVLLTAECKFYTGNLGIALGREFLGITAELGTEGRFMISNSDGRSVDRVLAHHKRNRSFHLTPLSPDSEQHVISQFQTVFGNDISKRR